MRKHISEDGMVRNCKAKTPETCTAKGPNGEKAEHFETAEEARARSEKILSEQYGNNSISKKNNYSTFYNTELTKEKIDEINSYSTRVMSVDGREYELKHDLDPKIKAERTAQLNKILRGKLTTEEMNEIVNGQITQDKSFLAARKKLPLNIQKKLATDEDSDIRWAMLVRVKRNKEIGNILAKDKNTSLRHAMATYDGLANSEQLDILFDTVETEIANEDKEEQSEVRKSNNYYTVKKLAINPKTSKKLITKIFKSPHVSEKLKSEIFGTLKTLNPKRVDFIEKENLFY